MSGLAESAEALRAGGERRDAPGVAEAVWMTCSDERGQGTTVGPVRLFPSHKGQRNFPGCYFAACTGRLVGFESWLERNEAMASAW